MNTSPLAERIRERLKKLNITANAASQKAGGSPSLIPNILLGRSENPRLDTIRKIAIALETTPEWLSDGIDGNADEVVLADVPPPQMANMPKNIPVMGTASGSLISTNGDSSQFEGFQVDMDPIQYVRQPSGIAGQRDVYAIFIVGDSMYPMHPPGDVRFVQPHRPPAPGDTVIVQTRHWAEDPGQAYIKIFRRRSGGKVVLEQLNPIATLQIPIEFVVSMHRVVPNNELFGL